MSGPEGGDRRDEIPLVQFCGGAFELPRLMVGHVMICVGHVMICRLSGLLW
jgi:hypothetical protein